MSIPSPCISICHMHPATGWCEGCGRTIDEIAAWGQMDERVKWSVWKALPARRERLQALMFDSPDGSDRPDDSATPPTAERA